MPFPHTYGGMLTQSRSVIHPDGDFALTGDWELAPLWENIDEDFPDDGSDDIYTDVWFDHLSASAYIFTVDLETPSATPDPSAVHQVTGRFRREDIISSTPPNVFDLTIEVLELTTVRATRPFPDIQDFWTTISFDLTALEVAAISDYADLRIRVTAALTNGSSGKQQRARCTWLQMEFL